MYSIVADFHSMVFGHVFPRHAKREGYKITDKILLMGGSYEPDVTK